MHAVLRADQRTSENIANACITMSCALGERDALRTDRAQKTARRRHVKHRKQGQPLCPSWERTAARKQRVRLARWWRRTMSWMRLGSFTPPRSWDASRLGS